MSELPSKEMAAFEAWAKLTHTSWWPNAHEDGTYQWGGVYHNAALNLCWQGWQARAAHEPPAALVTPEQAKHIAYFAHMMYHVLDDYSETNAQNGECTVEIPAHADQEITQLLDQLGDDPHAVMHRAMGIVSEHDEPLDIPDFLPNQENLAAERASQPPGVRRCEDSDGCPYPDDRCAEFCMQKHHYQGYSQAYADQMHTALNRLLIEFPGPVREIAAGALLPCSRPTKEPALDDPPKCQCNRCGRKTWEPRMAGKPCGMRQPHGGYCDGTMTSLGESGE